MSNMSTFGTFTMARLGIYVSQQALNVTGNNISNINTEGYSRQQLDQRAMSVGNADRYITKYSSREAGGVLSTGVNQLRDQYLDIRYRNEMTKVGEMDAKLNGLSQLAEIFDEVAKGEDGEGVLEARFNDLVQQLENLSQPQNIGTETADKLVREAAEAITTQFRAYAEKLETLTETKTQEFKDTVESVNTTLGKIRDLNETIRKAEIFGGEALVQKDERNLLIDELSEKLGISVTYETESLGDGREVDKLVIKTSGLPERTLVDGIYSAELSIAKVGGDVQKRNANGELVYDANNNPVYEKQAVDSPYFDLTVSELRDGKGKPDPSEPNKLELSIDSFSTAAAQDGGTVFTSEKEAKTVWEMLNSDPNYYTDPNDPTKAYYYHLVSQRGADGTTSYVIHQHETSAANREQGASASGYVVNPFQYVNVTTSQGTVLGDTELSGGLQAMRELLTEEGEYADADDLARDPEAGTKRGIPYYRQALDTLARKFAEAMNAANDRSALVYESDGEYTGWKTGYWKNANGQYLDANGSVTTDPNKYATVYVDEDGNRVTDMNKRVQIYVDSEGNPTDDPNKYTRFVDKDGNVTTDPSEYVLKEEYSYYNGGALFANRGDSSGTAEGITAANISVAYDWSHGSTRVLRSTAENSPSLRQDNIDHIINVLTSKHTFVFGEADEGTTYFKGTFQEMLTDTIAGTLAKDQNITDSMLDNYTATKEELYLNRDAVMGVDLNDEAMNMMMFQKAYSAACRLMTTYDGMLDKLINGTAV